MVWAVEEPFSFLFLSTRLFHFLMVLYEHFFIHTPHARFPLFVHTCPIFISHPTPPPFLGFTSYSELLAYVLYCIVIFFLTCISYVVCF